MTMIKKILFSIALLSGLSVTGVSVSAIAEIKQGDTVQLLSNLHPDPNRLLLYSLNYQLLNVIPVCSVVKVVSMKRKKMVFSWKGVRYTFKYDGHTKKAGVSFAEAVSTFFGPRCDKSRMNRLSKADREGIRLGRAKVGMSRDGILFALGRPPYHANPDLSLAAWTYWINKFNRVVIEFDQQGQVTAIRD